MHVSFRKVVLVHQDAGTPLPVNLPYDAGTKPLGRVSYRFDGTSRKGVRPLPRGPLAQ